jgi:hypothetical protein
MEERIGMYKYCVKGKLFLCLIKHHTMTIYVGIERYISTHSFPLPALVERFPGTPWIGGCLGLGATLDAVAKRSVTYPYMESSSNSSFV